MVARDGIEPPPPAFSPTTLSGSESAEIDGGKENYTASHLGRFRITWTIFAPAMFPYFSREFGCTQGRLLVKAAIYALVSAAEQTAIHARGIHDYAGVNGKGATRLGKST